MSVQAPRGFVEMCSRLPDLCDAGPALTLASASAPAAEPVVTQVAQLESRKSDASDVVFEHTRASSSGERYETVRTSVRKQTVSASEAFGPEALQAALEAEAAGGATGSVEPVRAGVGPESAMVAPLKIEAPKPIVQVAAAKPVSVGDPSQALLDTINRRVNGMVRQQSDWATYHVEELWNRPIAQGGFLAGDCEDIAIEKREELIEAGVDPKRLFFGVVYRHDIGLHVLLMVSTERGDLALDSRSPWIEAWNKVPYIWVKRQLAENQREWVMVAPAGAGPAPMRVANASSEMMIATR